MVNIKAIMLQSFSLVLLTAAAVELGIGDRCGSNGFCKKLDDCEPAKKAIKANISPQSCSSWDGKVPVVCCTVSTEPPSSTTPKIAVSAPTKTLSTSKGNLTQSISRKMCEKYGDLVYREEAIESLSLSSKRRRVADCGAGTVPLVLGGDDAKPKEFPHMAQIGFRAEKKEAVWLCGGALISERFILSAAHCTNPHPEILGPAKWAKLGDLDTNSDKDDAMPEIIEIIERIDHPDYSANYLYNDIALFKLSNAPVGLGPYIRPICLNVKTELPSDLNTLIATGWGHTKWGGNPSSRLQKVNLNLVNTESCNSSYKSFVRGKLNEGIRESTMICAGDKLGKDTCQGDSGGPLQIKSESPYCTYSVVGIVSFGKGCGLAGYPGVYTRVSHYVSWIESVVWPNE